MQKKSKIIIASVVVLIALLIVIFGHIGNVETETVLSGTMENSSFHQAILIKNEYVITPETDGNIRTLVKEGELVSSGKNIATVYKKDVDEDIQKKLSQVSDRINEIVESENSDGMFTNDRYKIDAQISDKIKEMVYYLNTSDVENASKIKSQINTVFEKKLNITGDKETVTILNSLISEQREYERRLAGSKEEIYSPRSGYFSVNVDSFEEILTLKTAKDLSVKEFDSVIEKIEKKESQEVSAPSGCKIIDNFEWMIAIKADEKRAKDFSVGEEVFVNFEGTEKENSATVESISQNQDGECIILLNTAEYNPDVINVRSLNVNLIKNRYTGLKVSNKAIREVNGETGVYVLVDTIVRFKKAEVVYSDDTHSIVRENNALDNALLLYDEVILSDGDKLYDGKSIR